MSIATMTPTSPRSGMTVGSIQRGRRRLPGHSAESVGVPLLDRLLATKLAGTPPTIQRGRAPSSAPPLGWRMSHDRITQDGHEPRLRARRAAPEDRSFV